VVFVFLVCLQNDCTSPREMNGDIFDQVADCCCLKGALDLFFLLKASQAENLRLGLAFPYDLGGREVIHLGHCQIHQNHIRMEQFAQLEGLLIQLAYDFKSSANGYYALADIARTHMLMGNIT
jgi:hypothetical protein